MTDIMQAKIPSSRPRADAQKRHRAKEKTALIALKKVNHQERKQKDYAYFLRGETQWHSVNVGI